jgi:CheY-like chemotaxis protein
VTEGDRSTREACILLVEDDGETRAMLRRVLEEPGYAVVEANNGREALEVLTRRDRPDVQLIVSDIEMPEMSGDELLAELSDRSQLSGIPVILVSGAARQSGPLPGVAGYLVKPVQVERLLALTRQHFQSPS